MNSQPHPQSDDLSDLDRLVDGELSERARRELLAQLDRGSDGWRRLALSFLESQCWQETARGFAEPDSAEAPPASTGRPSLSSSLSRPRGDGTARSWMTAPLAMAASFLVAFALGVLLRSAWQQHDAPPSMPFARSGDRAFSDALAARQAAAAAQSRQRADSRPADLAAAENPRAHPASVADDAAEVWLPVDLANAGDDLEVNPGPAVPQRVLDSFRRLGHRIETHRSLWPIELKNGQRAFVPVDEVEIHYVGNTYQ